MNNKNWIDKISTPTPESFNSNSNPGSFNSNSNSSKSLEYQLQLQFQFRSWSWTQLQLQFRSWPQPCLPVGVEPRTSNLDGRVIYVGRVSSIACFIINIINTTFITKNYKRLLKITQIYKWQQNMNPTERELFEWVGGLNDNHTYPISMKTISCHQSWLATWL